MYKLTKLIPVFLLLEALPIPMLLFMAMVSELQFREEKGGETKG